MQYLSRWSCKSNHRLFLLLWKQVETSSESSSRHSCSIFILWVRRWLGMPIICASLLRINVQTCPNLIFNCTLLCVARFSRAILKDDTKSRGLGLQRIIGSCEKLEDIGTDDWIWLPIHVVYSVSRMFHLPHKLFQFWKWPQSLKLLINYVRDIKSVQFVKEVFDGADTRSFGKIG